MQKILNITILITVIFASFLTNASDLKVGDMAPNFKLQATTGKFYQLSDYRNKQMVVLAWYPMANTRGCTIECRSLVQQGHLIRDFDVSYMMVSVDPLDKNIGFAKDMEADFPMLSDPTKATAKAYDVLNFLRVASRVTFYISKSGHILKIDDEIHPATSAEDIARTLKQLKVKKSSQPSLSD